MEFKNILKIKGLKYWIATALFVVVILFIDPNNMLVTWRLQRQVSQLHREEAQLKDAIQADSTANAQLHESPDAIEHYARENYYMKRPNEDIFVVK